MKALIHYILAVLEGGLAGGCFYYAGQAEEKARKVILYLASALWFAVSVLDALEGGRALRERKTLEVNGGNDDE